MDCGAPTVCWTSGKRCLLQNLWIRHHYPVFPNAKTEPRTSKLQILPAVGLDFQACLSTSPAHWGSFGLHVRGADFLTFEAGLGRGPESLSHFIVSLHGGDWLLSPIMGGGSQVLGEMKEFPGHPANEWIPLMLFGSLWDHPSWFNNLKPEVAPGMLPALSHYGSSWWESWFVILLLLPDSCPSSCIIPWAITRLALPSAPLPLALNTPWFYASFSNSLRWTHSPEVMQAGICWGPTLHNSTEEPWLSPVVRKCILVLFYSLNFRYLNAVLETYKRIYICIYKYICIYIDI
jgi:hypothetical protein